MSHSILRQRVAALLDAIEQAGLEGDGPITNIEVADCVEALQEAYDGDSGSDGIQRLMPIETAPRDGSYILLAGPSGYASTPLRFAAGQWSNDRNAWVDHAHDRLTDGGAEPTLWMPRPEVQPGDDAEGGMNAYTVFVQQSDGTGTIHISSHEARNTEDARKKAIAEVMEDWGEDDANALHILGVAEGDINILEWEDVDG